jgi:predicted GIY-YIG superfamily endonuclease
MHEHRSESVLGFTKTYHVKKLVYFEIFEKPYDAICCEKAMKKWYRKWKVELIEAIIRLGKICSLMESFSHVLLIKRVRYPRTRV